MKSRFRLHRRSMTYCTSTHLGAGADVRMTVSHYRSLIPVANVPLQGRCKPRATASSGAWPISIPPWALSPPCPYHFPDPPIWFSILNHTETFATDHHPGLPVACHRILYLTNHGHRQPKRPQAEFELPVNALNLWHLQIETGIRLDLPFDESVSQPPRERY
jgi:hypothetical protein